jgi:hypothetical protein
MLLRLMTHKPVSCAVRRRHPSTLKPRANPREPHRPAWASAAPTNFKMTPQVMPGVTIGDQSIVVAGSFVKTDVPGGAWSPDLRRASCGQESGQENTAFCSMPVRTDQRRKWAPKGE